MVVGRWDCTISLGQITPPVMIQLFGTNLFAADAAELTGYSWLRGRVRLGHRAVEADGSGTVPPIPAEFSDCPSKFG